MLKIETHDFDTDMAIGDHLEGYVCCVQHDDDPNASADIWLSGICLHPETGTLCYRGLPWEEDDTDMMDASAAGRRVIFAPTDTYTLVVY